MKLVVNILLVVIIAALVDTGDGKAAIRSRFLAARGPKKCYVDPLICQSQESRGQDCCGDQCVDLNTDTLNCGKCGKVCKFSDSCCEGKCQDLTFDKKNCGGCGNRCAKGAKCYYGLCNYA